MEQRWNSECLRCITTKHIGAFPKDAPEEKKMEYQRRLLGLILASAPDEGAPVVTDYILKLKEEMFGIVDDYTEIKRKFNALMLDQEQWIREDIFASGDPLYRAVQYVMTGNYIDFGIMSDVNSETLMKLLSGAENQPVDADAYQAMCQDFASVKKLVLLTDNCGEIVLDKLLLEAIKHRFPQISFTTIVRGLPAMNDATMEDALQVGLDKEGPVIGNGSSMPGTHLPVISEEARSIIENADAVISKGQGNFETLRGCGMNIYYIFLCKCELFTARFNKKLYEGMLIRESDL